MGMAQKAKTGPGILGFQSPLGYRVDGGRLHVEPGEARIVQRMFDLCLRGKTLEEIAAEMERLGARTKRGTSWNPVKVHRILHNPVYAGFLRWDGLMRKGEHESLVAVESFNRVQELLRSRAPVDVAQNEPIVLEA